MEFGRIGWYKGRAVQNKEKFFYSHKHKCIVFGHTHYKIFFK